MVYYASSQFHNVILSLKIEVWMKDHLVVDNNRNIGNL